MFWWVPIICIVVEHWGFGRLLHNHYEKHHQVTHHMHEHYNTDNNLLYSGLKNPTTSFTINENLNMDKGKRHLDGVICTLHVIKIVQRIISARSPLYRLYDD